VKRKKLYLSAAVPLLLLLGFYVYQSCFLPASAPDQLEYLSTANQPATLEFAATVYAGNPGSSEENASTTGTKTYDFSSETIGAQPRTFAPAVGNWIIGTDADNTVLVVDGRKWKQGTASAGLADKARALYGNRYAEFLDNVTAYAYYPFAVADGLENFSNGEITVRFKAIAGRIDQGAGILFDLKTNGDYYALRANPLENNLVLWRFKQGKRSSVNWVRNVNTPSRKWHTLRLTVEGTQIKGYVNGKQYLSEPLPAQVSGKVGLWTKADSVVYFDDFQVTEQ
jgi:hypothetical protein